MANINKRPRDENGREHGEWFNYHPNGQLNYFHGIAHGLFKRYFKDGTLMYCGCYDMGRQVGYWYSYYERKYHLCLI